MAYDFMQRSCHSIRLIFLAFGLGISAWAPLIPFAKSRLKLDEAELGLVLLSFGIGALLIMPFTGWIINKVGNRLVILISGLSVLTILPLLAIPQSTLLLCLTLFLFGVATGAMNVSMNAEAVNIERACQSSILSGIHCWFSVGGLLGAMSISILLSLGFESYSSMLIISSIILLLLVTQWKYLLPFTPKPQISKTENKKLIIPNNHVLILGGLCFIAFMAEGSILDWSAEYLRSNLNYEASRAGIGYALFSIAMATGRFMGDRLIRQFNPTQIFQIGSLLAASGFLIIVNVTWGYFELIGFCLIGLGASNIVPILFSSSGKLSNISSDTALTIVTTFGYMGLLLGPVFIGFLAQLTSLSTALTVIAFLLITIGLYKKAIPASEMTSHLQLETAK